MTKLDGMWVALAKYQSKADKRGHGATWAEMCKLKTVAACTAAAHAADVVDGATTYASYATTYASWATAKDAANVDYWAQEAIRRINKATGETE
jgi:hypothetical protein